jgi:hypothetical protein
MRNTFFLLMIFFAGGPGAFAQGGADAPPAHYIFEKFQKGKVLQRSGEVNEVELNYNTLTSEMIFNDGQKYMALAEPEKIDTVYIAGRVFVPGENKFYEVLAAGAVLKNYISTLTEQGNNLGYGMNSTTTSVTPLKSLIQGGQAYSLKLPDGYTVVTRHEYLIRKDGALKPANTAKQLSNIFTGEKDAINKWVKEKHTNFSVDADVAALVEALEKGI